MKPYVVVLDDFLEPLEFDLLRSYAWALEYKDQVAPFDGQTYPNIGLPVPESVEQRLSVQLSWIMGYKVVPKYVAFRLSLEGSDPPQWAHSDLEVARYNFLLSLNEGPASTLLLSHMETDMQYHPRNDFELGVWRRDFNDSSKWHIRAEVDLAPNRAVIMDSGLIHAADPRRGYGETVHDGRLILLSFFD